MTPSPTPDGGLPAFPGGGVGFIALILAVWALLLIGARVWRKRSGQ